MVYGRWKLDGDLDALGGEFLNRAILAAMDPPSEDDPRTPAQRRAAAMIRIAKFFLDHKDGLPLEGGEAPHVSLMISFETIMSWLPIRNIPEYPGDLGALISHSQRDQLLCDANIARIVVGPDSRPLDVGRAQRVVNRWMRRALAFRDRGCRYPGCMRTANWCEAHHVLAWWAGGHTAIDNLVLLCPFHHHVVHRQGWTNTFNGTTYEIHDHNGRRIE